MTTASSVRCDPPTCSISGFEVSLWGIETGPSPRFNDSSPPGCGHVVSPGHRTRPLMYHTRDHVTLRRRDRESPRPVTNRCVEKEGAASLAVRDSFPNRPHWSMTTDSASLSSSRGDGAPELAGTPCGQGNPGDRVHSRAWGRLQHATEVNSSKATWGRSQLVTTPTPALKVRTWGRTTEAHFSTRNPAGDVPNRSTG